MSTRSILTMVIPCFNQFSNFFMPTYNLFVYIFRIPQLSISNASTPPPSTSPIVKTEPLSPRDLQHHSGLPNVQSHQQLHHQLHQLQRPQSANSVLSPHLSPNHVASGMQFERAHAHQLTLMASGGLKTITL